MNNARHGRRLPAVFAGVLLGACLATATTRAATAANQNVTVMESTANVFFYLEGSGSSVTLVAAPVHGTLKLYVPNDGMVSWTEGQTLAIFPWIQPMAYYTPTPGFVGRDSFTWRAQDEGGQSPTAVCNINVVANTPPTASPFGVSALTGETKTFQAIFRDPDTQSFTLTVVTQPAHGTVNAVGTKFNYTPAAGYTGADSFTWKVSDGTATSAPVTCRVLVREAGSRQGLVVALLVNARLQPEIQPELDRLRSDLESEGYSVAVRSFTNATTQAVWSHLTNLYSCAAHALAGAILIGGMPAAASNAGTTSDMAYWNMRTLGDTSCRDIWVSRLHGPATSYFGDEVTLLKRALQANHDFRTGRSRYPHEGHVAEQWDYVYDPYDQGNAAFYTNALSEILRVGLTASPAVMWEQYAGAYYQAGCHGNNGTYGINLGGNGVNNNRLHATVTQMRYASVNSCLAGNMGGPVANHLWVRNGGNVFSIGSSSDMYIMQCFEICWPNSTATRNFRARLNAGDAWGTAAVDHCPFVQANVAMCYGDLSLPLKPCPDNQMPVIDAFTCSATAGAAPLSVAFSAQARDPDGEIAAYEWYCLGNGLGKVGPVAAGAGVTTLVHTYTLPHRYPARLEVADNHQARAAREVWINVAPDPDKPLRINCGRLFDSYSDGRHTPDQDHLDGDGNVWLHDQEHAAGTWGYANPWANTPAPVQTGSAILGTDDQVLFRNAMRGGTNLVYTIPLAPGDYQVRLGFAEIQCDAPGTRLMDIRLNGANWLAGYDIFARAGGKNRVVHESTPASVSAGALRLELARSAGCTWAPLLSTIEVYPVKGELPVARFVARPAGGPAPLAVSFDASASGGPVAGYLWDFGDGMRAVGATPTHWFRRPGTYTVQLQVSDAAGASDMTSTNITVTAFAAGATDVLTLQRGLGGYDGAQDAHLDPNGGNYGARPTLSTWLPWRDVRPILRFDLADVPVDAHILSAELQLRCTEVTKATAGAMVGLHRVTTNWVEGTRNGSGTPDGATWTQAAPGVEWTTPGGDHDPTPAARVPTEAITANEWIVFDVTALANGWRAGAFPNNGVLLVADGVATFSFPASEHADVTLRPRLVITHTATAVNHAPVALGGTVRAVTGLPADCVLAVSDQDGNVPRAYAIVSPPRHGALSGTPPRLVYTSDSGFTGADSFAFVACDGADWSTPGVVTIQVAPAAGDGPTCVLTVAVAGDGDGEVLADPPGSEHPLGSVVRLTAVPAPGSLFAGWSGALSGTDNPAWLTMTGDMTVTAVFAQTAPPGAPPVIVGPPAVTGEVGAVFSHVIAARPAADGFLAAGLPAWLSLDPAGGMLSGVPPGPLTADIAITATNAFGSDTRTLRLTVLCAIDATAGPGGAIEPAGHVLVAGGGSVAFTVTPAPWHRIAGVTVDGAPAGTAALHTFANVTTNHVIAAVFAARLAPGGTPEWWLAQHGWTNDFARAELADADGDGVPNGREYLARTDPADPLSRPPFNFVPYAESFENLAGWGGVYTGVAPLMGWHASPGDASRVARLPYVYEGRLPLPSATHTNVLLLETGGGVLTNSFGEGEGLTGARLHLDMMVMFEPCETPPARCTAEDSGLKTGAFLGRDGRLAVYHGVAAADGSWLSNAVDSTSCVLGTGGWHRLTIMLDGTLAGAAGPLTMVQLKVDGTAVACGAAYGDDWRTTFRAGGLLPPLSPAGTWFRAATAGGAGPPRFEALEFEGTGMLDDLSVSKRNPFATPPLLMLLR
jgi:PKD repeat protein